MLCKTCMSVSNSDLESWSLVDFGDFCFSKFVVLKVCAIGEIEVRLV